jgi:hypothetical protein
LRIIVNTRGDHVFFAWFYGLVEPHEHDPFRLTLSADE